MAPIVWFITGTSSGIGLDLVHSVLARGDKVIATARKIEKIEHLKKLGAHVLKLDVTDGQQVLDEVAKEAIGVYGKVDVLVNNAGYCAYGTLEDVLIEQWKAQYETNVFGVVNVTRAFMPHFRSQRDGIIIFIGSKGGWDSLAAASPYCSSKFALEGIAEGFGREIAHLDIKTINVEPGMFRTDVLSSENAKPVLTSIPEYEEVVKPVHDSFLTGHGKQEGDPKKLVEIVVDIVRQEGRAAGKGIPERLPLGKDAVASMKEKCERTLKLIKEWEEISCSTDFDE